LLIFEIKIINKNNKNNDGANIVLENIPLPEYP
jgi:hypothetical protein